MASSRSRKRPETDTQLLARLAKGVPVAMLTTRAEGDEHFRSRPMTLQETDFDGDFWFVTGKRTSVAEDLRTEPHVNLSFTNPKSGTYVSASGIAEVVLDRAKIKGLWTPVFETWFPLGLEDPELCLLRVHVERAEYWENASSKAVLLFGFSRALIAPSNNSELPGIFQRAGVNENLH